MSEIIITILAFLNIYLVYKKIISQNIRLNKYFLLLIFLLHYVAFMLYYNFSIVEQKDSFLFYQNALEANSIMEFKFYGSQFMSIITYPFAQIGINYFTVSFVFATISFLAFLKYYDFLMLRLNEKNYAYLIAIFLLIPSLHFWTAGLTKEALIFYFMCVIFLDIYKKQRLTLLISFSSLAIFLIRPYLFFILGLAFIIHYMFNFKGALKEKRITLLLIILTTFVLTPILINFLKLTEFNIERIQYNFDSLIRYSKNFGGSSIDLENSSYLERLFLVLFRPLFFDAKTLFQYLISIENAAFLILLIKLLRDVFLKKLLFCSIKKELFLIISAALAVLFFSIYMYNLGLASRMRIMFMPYIYLFIYLIYNKSQVNKIE